MKCIQKENRLENHTLKKKHRVSKKENGFQPLGEKARAKIHPQYLDSLNEEIKQRAHEIFCGRNGNPGSALSDWLQAEQEIKEKYSAKQGIIERPERY